MNAADLMQVTNRPTIENAKQIAYTRLPAEQRTVVTLDGLGEEREVRTTGPDGGCTFESLPPRIPLHVEALRNGRIVGSIEGVLELTPGVVTKARVIARSAGPIRLRFAHADGLPLRTKRIGLKRAEGSASYAYFPSGQAVLYERVTDSEGLAEFRNVVAGEYFAGPRGGDGSEGIDRHSVAVRISIGAGPTDGIVDVSLPAAAYVIGVVADLYGAPLETGSVMSTSTNAVGMIVSDLLEGGSFRVGPVAPGRCTLRARDAESVLSSKPTSATAGDEGVELRLEPPRRLSVRLAARDGLACGLARITVVTESELHVIPRVDAVGPDTYELGPIPPMPRVLLATCDDGRMGIAAITAASFESRRHLEVAIVAAGDLSLRAPVGRRQTVRVLTREHLCLANLEIEGGHTEHVRAPVGEVAIQSTGPDGEILRSTVVVASREVTEFLLP
jgi:hypothetical protein